MRVDRSLKYASTFNKALRIVSVQELQLVIGDNHFVNPTPDRCSAVLDNSVIPDSTQYPDNLAVFSFV